MRHFSAELRGLLEKGTRFDVVLTNPPFSMDYAATVPEEQEILETDEDAVSECVDKVFYYLGWALNTACQASNGDVVACANNLMDKINDTLANACNYRVATDGTNENGTSECVEAVNEWLHYVMNTACQSTDASQCANNLIGKVNDTITVLLTGRVSNLHFRVALSAIGQGK